MNDFTRERDLKRVPWKKGRERIASPRDVSPPDGFELMPLMDPFEAWVGPFFVRTPSPIEPENKDAPLEAAFQIDERHVNASGICHGGMFLGFADATLGIIPNVGKPSPAVTLSMQSQFLKPGKLGDWVFTRPRVIRETPSIFFVESDFTIDDELVFTATSLWKVTGK